MSKLTVDVIAKLNKQLSKSSINNDLKSLNNTMYVRVLAKLSKTLASRELKRQLKELDNMKVNVGTKIKVNKSTEAELRKSIKGLQKTVSDLEIGLNTSQMKAELQSMRNEMRQKIDKSQLADFNREVKNSESAAQSAEGKWKQLAARFKDFFSSAAISKEILSQIRQAVDTAIDLDKTYTSLLKANDELSRGDYDDYLSRCNQRAQELATSQKTLMEGATEFSRLGFDLGTSDKLAEKSVILANVGDISLSDSTQAIAAGINAYDTVDGYGDAAGKAQALIDKYAELGSTSSITTAELARGVQSVGTAFSETNTSVDEFLALLGAGNQQYQNAEALATALGNSSLRIRGASDELARAGEDVDGVMSVIDNQKAIKALTGVDILENDKETVRSIYDIFLDISEVYQDMSSKNQGTLLDILGGKNQASAIDATLKSMANAQSLLQDSLHASGSAQKEYETYLDSTEAHLQQFQSKLVETYSGFVNGDMVSYAAEFGTMLLDIVNKADILKNSLIAIATIKIGQGMATFGDAIVGTVTQMNTLGNALQQIKNLPIDVDSRNETLRDLGDATQALTEKNLKLLLSQKQLKENDQIMILTQHELTEEEAKAKLEKLGLTDATKSNTIANAANASSVNVLKGTFTGLTASVKAAWVAMSTLEKASVILAGLSTAYSIISSFISYHNQATEEALQKTKDAVDEYKEAASSINDYVSKYQELRQALQDAKGNEEETYNIKKQLLTLQAELNNKFGDECGIIDLVTDAYNDQTEAIRALNQEKAKQFLNENRTGINEATKKMEAENPYYLGSLDALSALNLTDAENDIVEEIKQLAGMNGIQFTANGFEFVGDAKEASDAINDFLNGVHELQKASGKDADGIYAIFENIYASSQDALNRVNDIVGTYGETYDEAKMAQIYADEDLSDGYYDAIEAVNAYNEAVLKSENPYHDEDVEAAWHDMQRMEGQIIKNKDVWGEYSDIMNGVFAGANDKAYSFYQLMQNNNTVSALADDLKDLSETDLSDIYNGKGSNESFEQLCERARQYGLEAQNVIDLLMELRHQQEESQGTPRIDESFYNSAADGAQTMADKLGILKSAYEGIQNGDGVDWFSILNNEEFENAFKDAGSAYGDFVHAIIKNSDDVDACQNAFGQFVSTILDNSGIFDDLTEETKEATIAMLEQNGIMNAAAIVEQKLAAYNEYLAMTKDIAALAGKNLADVTYEEITAILNEGVASNETASYLAQLAFAKMDVNNMKLDTTDDINQIIAIANAAGASASYIQVLATMLAKLHGTSIEISPLKTTGQATGSGILVKGMQNMAIGALENLLSDAIATQYQTTKIDPAQFYGKRTGGSGGRVPGSSGGSGGGSGGSGGGASEAAKETVETFDWVENKLESLERHVKKLDQTVGRTYKGWSERNSALNQEILEVGGQVWGQVLAYQEYMKKADAVGLSEHYKNLVKDGAIAIEDISDEGLKQQISDFQKWYEKARKCEEEAEELNDTLADLGKTIFEHATQMFEGRLSVMEYSLDMIDAYIDQAEARGHLAGTAYYDSLIKMEQGHISLLKEEYDALTDALAQAMKAGNIEKYSEEWYDMYNSVLDVDKAITEATTSLYEHQNALRELKWDYFEKQQEYTSKLTEEADWLIGLLEKQGSFVEDGDSAFAGSRRRTRRGTAAEGLHALNYNVYMAQADDYAKEILKINEMLAKDPYNLELIEKRNEFLEAQRDNIDAAYDEIEAVKDLMSEGYDAYLDKLQQLIDKRKEALGAERDLYDYQKSIAEKTGNIASLEKQLNAYAGDDSEEAASKVQQLKLELDEAKTDLEETEYEKWVSDQERLMDALYTEYEQLFNQRLDDVEFVLESMKDTANANAEGIRATLEQATAAVGTALSDEMKNIWKNDGGAGSIVSTYGSGMTAGLTSIQQTLDGIRNFVSAMAGDARQEAADNVAALETRQEAAANKAPTPPAQEAPKQELQTLEPAGSRTDTSFFVHRKDEYPKNKLNVETSIVDRLKYHDYDSSFSQMARYYAAMGFSGTYTGSASQNINMLNWMKSHGLSEGGEIQGLLRQSGETGFALVRTGETVITSEATQNLKAMLKMKDRLGMRKTGKYVFPDAQRMRQQTDEQMKWFQTAPQNTQNNNENVTIQIDNLSLPNVKNYDEFKTALLSDPHFEKVMGQAMADQMLGGNPFNKFRYI